LALYSSGSTEKTKLENKANWSDININSTNSKSQKIKIVDVVFNASASRTFLKIVGDIKDEIQNVTDFSISGTKYVVIGPPTVATDLKQFSGRLAKANKFTRRTLSNSNESSPTTNIGMNFKIIEPI
jgi:hypothetical protein